MEICAISSIFGCCAGYQVMMANGPAIIEEIVLGSWQS
jgi:hypothetical protein